MANRPKKANMSSLQLLSRDSFSFFLFLSLPISHGKDAAINVCLAPAAGNARLPLPNATLSYATVQLLPEPPECTFISYSLIAWSMREGEFSARVTQASFCAS
mmetsp:Transcript_40162/g.95327  ORF Transcript_40162/g.95327 Transcript_40162/m.95327 type:complete len:103 (-) Transcript_40162:2147-2455(-)